jgi:hypothetical protein
LEERFGAESKADHLLLAMVLD